MTITPALIATWRSETASTMPETSTIWRDLSDTEKLKLLEWLSEQPEVEMSHLDKEKSE